MKSLALVGLIISHASIHVYNASAGKFHILQKLVQVGIRGLLVDEELYICNKVMEGCGIFLKGYKRKTIRRRELENDYRRN
jgi:hypothetical protein